MFEGEKELDPKKLQKLHEKLDLLNEFLKKDQFACGDSITVADHCLAATVSSFEEAGIDISRHGKVQQWLKRCESVIPGYETENLKGLKKFGSFVKSKLYQQ